MFFKTLYRVLSQFTLYFHNIRWTKQQEKSNEQRAKSNWLCFLLVADTKMIFRYNFTVSIMRLSFERQYDVKLIKLLKLNRQAKMFFRICFLLFNSYVKRKKWILCAVV